MSHYRPVHLRRSGPALTRADDRRRRPSFGPPVKPHAPEPDDPAEQAMLANSRAHGAMLAELAAVEPALTALFGPPRKPRKRKP